MCFDFNLCGLWPLQVAMVGSHKGSCHIFDTSGMTALLSHISIHVQLCTYSFFYFC